MQLFGGSRFVLRFPTFPAPFPSTCGPSKVCHLQLESPSPSLLLLLLLLFYSLRVFLIQRWQMLFYKRLSDNKSPLVCRSLLSFLADLDLAVVWMVSSCPLIFKSTSPFTNLLGIFLEPRLQLVSLLLSYSIEFFSSLARSRIYLSLHFLLIFFFVVCLNRKSTIRQVLFFCWLSVSLVVWQRLGDVFWRQNPREVWEPHYHYYYYYYYYYYFQL